MRIQTEQVRSKLVEWSLNSIVGVVVIGALAWAWKLASGYPLAAVAIAASAALLAGVSFILWRILHGQPWLVSVPARLDGRYLRRLVSHTHKVYFAFGASCDDSAMGQALDKMLWDWHGKAIVLHKLFLAGDRSLGAAAQMKAIDYVCVNRAEVAKFFHHEPDDVLDRVARDTLVTDEVKKHADRWQERLRIEG